MAASLSATPWATAGSRVVPGEGESRAGEEGDDRALCPGLAARQLRDRSRERLDEIERGEWGEWAGGTQEGLSADTGASSLLFLLVTAFLVMVMVDPERSIRSLADQTVLVLRVLGQQRRPRGILRVLCCH